MGDFEQTIEKHKLTRRRALILLTAAPGALLASCKSATREPSPALSDCVQKVLDLYPGANSTKPGPMVTALTYAKDPTNPLEAGTNITVVEPNVLTQKPGEPYVDTISAGQLSTKVVISLGQDERTITVATGVLNTQTKEETGAGYIDTVRPTECNFFSISWIKGKAINPLLNGRVPRNLRFY